MEKRNADFKPIESASASTACQTTDSKFAYIVTGVVLGVIAMLALAFSLLLYLGIAAAVDSAYDYDSYYYDDYGWDGYYDDYDDYGWDLDGWGVSDSGTW